MSSMHCFKGSWLIFSSFVSEDDLSVNDINFDAYSYSTPHQSLKNKLKTLRVALKFAFFFLNSVKKSGSSELSIKTIANNLKINCENYYYFIHISKYIKHSC